MPKILHFRLCNLCKKNESYIFYNKQKFITFHHLTWGGGRLSNCLYLFFLTTSYCYWSGNMSKPYHQPTLARVASMSSGGQLIKLWCGINKPAFKNALYLQFLQLCRGSYFIRKGLYFQYFLLLEFVYSIKF